MAVREIMCQEKAACPDPPSHNYNVGEIRILDYDEAWKHIVNIEK